MQDGYPIRTGTIVGILLIALGIFLLAYFASPVRLMIRSSEHLKIDPALPILGTLSLVGGVVLLFATRPRASS
jgi:hypothetical protein